MTVKSLFLTVALASGAVALAAQSAPQPAPTPEPQPRTQQRMQRAPRAVAMDDEGFVAPHHRMQQALGLNEQQVASLDKLMIERRKAAIRQRADQSIARLELEELMRAETLDQKTIDAKIRQLAELHAAPLRARVDEHLAVQKILRPEQFKKWQEMRPRFGERAMRSRMSRGDRPMRWQDGRGPRGRAPMPPPAPEAPKPPADPKGESVR